MTIQLKDSIFIAGVHQAAGTSLTLGADMEAELVNRGVAVYRSVAQSMGVGREAVTVYMNPISGQLERWDAAAGGYVKVGDKLSPVIKASNIWLDDQPYAVTSPVRSAGKLVCRFKAAEWSGYGISTLSDTTGYDANGVKSGALTNGVGVGPVAITGHPTLLKMVPGDTSNEGIGTPVTFASTIKTTQLNGKVGLWVYLEGWQGPSLTLEFSTEGNATNCLRVTWSGAVLKSGWNFLVFVMRDYQAYVTGTAVSEYHPEGVIAEVSGTGSGANILTGTINYVRQYCGGADPTKPIYFDSMWTGFDVQAQYLIGFDSSAQSIIDYAMPKMRHKGYIAINMGSLYYDGTTRTATLYDNFTPRVQTIYDAGWEVVNHTTFHLPGSQASPNMAALTDAAEIAYELKPVQSAFLSKDWTRGQHFYVSPQSSTSQLCERVIGDMGYPLQRHGVGNSFVQITPFGIPNPRACGGFGIGSNSVVGRKTTGGVSAQVTGFHLIEQMKANIAAVIAYGATIMLFSHGIEVDGDDGTGNQVPTDPNNVKKSHFDKLMEHLDSEEDAGRIRGLDGSDQLWYGAHAQ